MPRRKLRGKLYSASAPVFFDTLQEWPIGGKRGRLRRNEPSDIRRGVGGRDARTGRKSFYSFWRSHALEGRPANADTEGIWPISEYRCQRHDGNPSRALWPSKDPVEDWPDEFVREALQYRIHHYYRLTRAAEVAGLLPEEPGKRDIQIAIGVTEDWFAPESGLILPSPDAEVLGTHAVPLCCYDPKDRIFSFPNSWGEEWGDDGWGYLPASVLDEYSVEIWAPTSSRIFPRLETTSGVVRLLWSSSRGFHQRYAIPDHLVYGRELVDVSSDERLAWAFARKRDRYLDIDEFFVWPTHRRKGYGRLLAEMLHELSAQTGRPLRLWVSHADAEARNSSCLEAALRLLNLHLHDSPVRWAAYVALPTVPAGRLRRYVAPARAAVPRFKLQPKFNAKDAAQTRDGVSYDVFFGTNRKPTSDNLNFGTERDSQTNVGICTVDIPKWHQFGEIKSTWIRRLTGYRDGTLRRSGLNRMKPARFWESLRNRVTDAGSSNVPDSLLFIHGYNVSFDAAAIRAAQIGFDLNVPGITAFFSWPSQGQLFGYPADEATIDASEPFLLDFMVRLVDACHPGRLHVVAHSMGNRAFLRSLQRVVGDAEKRAGFRLGQIILAAPDIDTHIFRDLASCYVDLSDRTTLYASPRDRALFASSTLHRFDRAGLTPPITVVNGIDTIVVPGFNLLDLGHGYFAEAEPLLYDMHMTMMHGAEPNTRPRLQSREDVPDGPYWELRL